MNNLRPEVVTFLHAAETLLSTVLLTKPYNEDECGMIAQYVESIRASILAPDGQGCKS
jgi:hypothetical protein